jgi:hypothetical protein
VAKRETPGENPSSGPLDGMDRALGLITLRLVRNWEHWVHRRVESIELTDQVTFRRRVSVDFTLPRDLEPAAFTGGGKPIYFVPLTLLAKDALTHFSVSDEQGATVPVLTRARNAAMAASALAVLAEGLVGEDFRRENGRLPSDVEEDLLALARSRDGAGEAERRLRIAPTDGGATRHSRAWRKELTRSKNAEFQRAVATFANGFILAVPLIGLPGQRRVIKFEYEEHGRRPELSVPWPLRRLAARWIADISGRAKPGTPRYGRREAYTPLPMALAKGVGWRARAVKIDTPAIHQCGSYHLEVAAPEGLNVTRGTLSSKTPPSLLAEVRKTVQRVHLYPQAPVPPHGGGAALITLRPQASVIVRTAWLTALFSTAVLALIAVRWRAVVTDLSATVSLLLLVPALLAGYVGRARESSVTTQVLFGLRILAVAPAMWLFAAGVMLLTGRTCHATVAGGTVCHSWSATSPVMWVLTGCAAATLWILSVTLTLIERPREQRIPASAPAGA